MENINKQMATTALSEYYQVNIACIAVVSKFFINLIVNKLVYKLQKVARKVELNHYVARHLQV